MLDEELVKEIEDPGYSCSPARLIVFLIRCGYIGMALQLLLINLYEFIIVIPVALITLVLVILVYTSNPICAINVINIGLSIMTAARRSFKFRDKIKSKFPS